jgi:hypothetical protein
MAWQIGNIYFITAIAVIGKLTSLNRTLSGVAFKLTEWKAVVSSVLISRQ